jgi:DNA helicase II / ATP-dependent DNA helicase PcrA
MLKSYRSTYEITQFSKRIRQNLDVEAIERYGEKPAIHSFKNEADELDHINHCIENILTIGC